jgi:hypothetical protein
LLLDLSFDYLLLASDLRQKILGFTNLINGGLDRGLPI